MFHLHHTNVLIRLMRGEKTAMLRNSSPAGADKDVCVLQQPSQDQNQPTCDHFPPVMETTHISRRPRWRRHLDDYVMSSSSQIVGTSPWSALCPRVATLKNTHWGTGFAPKQNKPHSSQSPRRWLGELSDRTINDLNDVSVAQIHFFWASLFCNSRNQFIAQNMSRTNTSEDTFDSWVS